MPINFNMVLKQAGVSPEDVRLLRHKDNRAKKGCTPYELWRDNRPQFEAYQSHQSISNREKLTAPYWASFVGTPNDETMFVGLYSVKYDGLSKEDEPKPHMDEISKAGEADVYVLTPADLLTEFIEKLIVDWGPGALAWVQYAVRQDKPILELRTAFKEENFPGFLEFIQPLSKINSVPRDWQNRLTESKGVYLLTCPRTKEHYIGSATGEDGFWGRWQHYIRDGHGGNVGLKSRDLSDYQVTILEVAGTALSDDEIRNREFLWMAKLQSRTMGLNRC